MGIRPGVSQLLSIPADSWASPNPFGQALYEPITDTFAEFCLAVATAEEGDLERSEQAENRQEDDDTISLDDDERAFVEVPFDEDVLLSDDDLIESDERSGGPSQVVEPEPRLPQDSRPRPQEEDSPRSQGT